jgi:osmotically inducible protein OsmC
VWSGGVVDGIGTVERPSRPGAEPIGWRDRTAGGPTGTTPEELLAAAHAGCLSMALARVLGANGTLPQRLVVNTTCELEVDAAGSGRIASIDAHVVARVPGVDGEELDAFVQRADAACHVANALRGNVAVNVTATLEQPAA